MSVTDDPVNCPPGENITKRIRPEYVYVIFGNDYGKIS